MPGILAESKKVLFNGDGYSEEWHAEAEKRGLPNLKNTVDALPIIMSKESVALFGKYKVYTEGELQSRFNIFCESYVKTVTIEAKLTKFMAATMIIPAVVRYQTELATAVGACKAVGVDGPLDLLKTVSTGLADLSKTVAALDAALSHHAEGELHDHAKYSRDTLLPKMLDVRKAADKLETVVADDLWPMPTYREMLFIR